ncbi:CRAL/TRIO domain-containing protein [Nadsonia fulvescens var. elongata DSM 6958]|uniref:Phosphatidylinositol transfer protein SFH5 n=1 Tax=Nadsonia fulvescens var. elongata DSM 6958 TaxID=857566 RepID=A0A1E3PKH5_9ASCO|nr:CRAL/TRIO domain-containing protein [Nadsonia fulvescens var. elongata DSM 6958]
MVRLLSHLGYLNTEERSSFEQLVKALPSIIAEAEYSEVYGHPLDGETRINESKDEDVLSPEITKELLIRDRLLLKFLKANLFSFEESKKQLTETLIWRKEFKPLSAAIEETHAADLDKLGIITTFKDPQFNNQERVVTWNLYGAVKNRQELFSRLDQFLRWRVSLMERGLALLKFDYADETEKDLAYMTQLHDYNNVSFLRLDAATKAASKSTIEMFQKYYPEILDKKYFVNVPILMGWIFSVVKVFLAPETVAKFNVLSWGSEVANSLGDWVPEVYGGKETRSLQELNHAEIINPPAWSSVKSSKEKVQEKTETEQKPQPHPTEITPTEAVQTIKN